MKTRNNIVIFDNDEYLRALLKGYCYANNMTITTLEFRIDGINKLETLQPKLVIVPLDSLSAANKLHVANLLKQISMTNGIKVCALYKNRTDFISPDLLEWVDVFISNPFDIGEIDRCFKSINVFSDSISEKRSFKERRLITDRRTVRSKLNDKNGDRKNETSGSVREFAKPESKGFQIDFRNKCLFINAHKVELTPKEFDLLKFLSTDADRVFMTDEIIEHLWPESDRATKSDLYQYMHLLRKKIEIDPNNPQWILTVKGFGYKLNVGKPERIDQVSPKHQEVPANPSAFMPLNLAYI